jgi:hypothetical protein
MGIVAGITFSFLKRYVLLITAGPEGRWPMTLVTELTAFFCGLERFLGSWRVMAFFAGNFYDLGMHACFKKLGLR